MHGIDGIVRIFEEIELRLVQSLKRNLGRHKQEEQDEEMNWSAWQAEKLRGLQKFRQENAAMMSEFTPQIDSETRQIMQEQFAEGVNGADAPPNSPQFFGVDTTKVNKLIEDISYLEKNAETAALRLTDDVYRQTVNRVQLAMSTGSMTLQQAIDLAVEDFLRQGVNCIVYRDGRRVNIADYVRMALRTSATRAALQGKSAKFKALGFDTVIVSSYSMCSETCQPWQGRVYIEDTFSVWDGEVRDMGGILWGKSNYCGRWFPLLSSAIEKGLFHPNCRHSIQLWRDGDPIPESIGNEKSERRYKLEQKQRRLENAVRQAKRFAEGLSDPEQIKEAKAELKNAQKRLKDFIEQVNSSEGETVLKRDYGKEKIYDSGIITQNAPADEKIPVNYVDKYSNSGIIEEGTVSEIPETIVKDVETAYNKVAGDFPIIKEQVEPIQFGDTKNALGENKFIEGKFTNVVRLSNYYCSDENLLSEKLKEDFESGFSYETDNVGSLACHELGHALHKILTLKKTGLKYGDDIGAINNVIFSQTYTQIGIGVYVVAFTDESFTEITKICTDELGKMTYGNSNELIAQSFGNYYYGKKKSRVAKAIVEYFMKELNS